MVVSAKPFSRFGWPLYASTPENVLLDTIPTSFPTIMLPLSGETGRDTSGDVDGEVDFLHCPVLGFTSASIATFIL
jgi:hypothetical protein